MVRDPVNWGGMTFEEFVESIDGDSSPPEGLGPELRALWLTRADRWEEAHDVAQDIPSKAGSWIHGLLHAIEGDFGNSGYWYHRAGEPPISADQIDGEWERIARSQIAEQIS